MLREMLKSKIQGLRITGLDLHCEGSITLDAGLLARADILPGEKVSVLNLDTGVRFETYAIAGPRGKGQAVLNGPAARLGRAGQTIFVLAYGLCSAREARRRRPRIVRLGPGKGPEGTGRKRRKKVKGKR